jgi:hypothetical protein
LKAEHQELYDSWSIGDSIVNVTSSTRVSISDPNQDVDDGDVAINTDARHFDNRLFAGELKLQNKKKQVTLGPSLSLASFFSLSPA